MVRTSGLAEVARFSAEWCFPHLVLTSAGDVVCVRTGQETYARGRIRAARRPSMGFSWVILADNIDSFHHSVEFGGWCSGVEAGVGQLRQDILESPTIGTSRSNRFENFCRANVNVDDLSLGERRVQKAYR